MMRPFIVSGGQTGVDRAALDVAIRKKIPYSGWRPLGGRAEDFGDPPGLSPNTPCDQPRQLPQSRGQPGTSVTVTLH
jgi:Circularly permutated YpsA SLOG family